MRFKPATVPSKRFLTPLSVPNLWPTRRKMSRTIGSTPPVEPTVSARPPAATCYWDTAIAGLAAAGRGSSPWVWIH